MQRVYGVTFPDKESLADYKHRMEEAKKRDHRTQGTKQELFFFDKLSPGSCFFLPNGARIYNTLIQVCYPHAGNSKLGGGYLEVIWQTTIAEILVPGGRGRQSSENPRACVLLSLCTIICHLAQSAVLHLPMRKPRSSSWFRLDEKLR